MSTGNPFSIGFRAARANLVPGLVIQAMMIGLVLTYYFFPPAHGAFQILADAKGRWGYAFSFTSSVIAAAILPALFDIAFLQRGRSARAVLADLAFLALFWGPEGMLIDAFYRFQGVMFGYHPGVATVLKKVFVDQFIYTPLFATPYTLVAYEFRKQGYRLSRIGHVFTAEFYRVHIVPALWAGWAVWIPVTGAIYSLPSLLQIPLFALALTFWVLMVAYITTRHQAAPAPAPMAEPIAD